MPLDTIEYHSTIKKQQQQSTDTCYNMDDPWEHLSKWKKRPYLGWLHF